MTNFRYNVEKAKLRCENVRKKLDEYVQKQEEVFMDVNSLKNCWMDVASDAYINKVTGDQKIINELCDSLYGYQKNIENFNEQLENIFCNEGYSSNNLDITFDSSKNNSAIGCLDSVCGCVNNALEDMRSCVVPCQYGYKYVIDEVFNDLYGIKDDSENYSNRVYNINRSIKSLTENSISNACSINQVSVDGKLLNISYSIQPIIPNLQSNIEKFSGAKVSIDSQNEVKTKESDISEFNSANIVESNVSLDEDSEKNVESLDNSDLIYNVVNADPLQKGGISKDEYTDTAVMSNTSTTTVDSIQKVGISKDEYTDTAVMDNISTVSADFKSNMNINSNGSDDIDISKSSKSVTMGNLSLEKASIDSFDDVKKSVSFNSGDLSSVNFGDIKTSSPKTVGDFSNGNLQNVSTSFETNGTIKHTDVSVNNLQQASRVSADDIINSRNM